MKKISRNKGFTLIEILIVIGIIAILATIVIVAINPSRQFAQARNSQRLANINAILNAIGQNIADNKGIFTCAKGNIPTIIKSISSKVDDYDLRGCLVPLYLPEILEDPRTGSHTENYSTYDTGYQIQRSIDTSRITITAPEAELGEKISVTR